jgi:lipoprotein NlpI
MMRALLPFFFTALVANQTGCSPKAIAEPKTAASAQGAIDPEALKVDDTGFAAATVAVVQNPVASPRRAGLLTGVVRRQLERAARYFATGHEDMGLAAVRGALYLVRLGEFRPEMIDGEQAALTEAAAAVARLGNEGQAIALYSLLVDHLPSGQAKEDASEHLKALLRWQTDTREAGSLVARGDAQRASVQQALLDPSPQTLDAAMQQTALWLDQAMALGGERTPPRDQFEQEARIEVVRAARTAALSAVAVNLRHGNASSALVAIDGENLARVTASGLRERVERAAEANDPDAWAELFNLYESSDPSLGDFGIDPDMARAAAWGAAIELYRSRPDSFEAAIPLSSLLLAHGMAEAAPLLFQQTLTSATRFKELSWVMGYALEAILQAESYGDLAAARRTFTNAEPLIKLAQGDAQRIKPSASNLYYAMGAIESRAGELERAHPHLKQAVALEATPDALRLLASIERQRKDYPNALASLDRVIELTAQPADEAAQAESWLMRFELLREMGQADAAAQSLASALKQSLAARSTGRTGEQLAVAERVLGRVLEQYGEPEAARRAGKRAYDASRNDMRQTTATVLDSSRRALTLGDLRTARDALRRALEADLADEDTVYAALWLRLLEQRLKVPSDGSAEEALSQVDNATGWVAKLTAWGRGRISDERLLEGAENRIERVEASFYVAMSSKTREASLKRLQEVAGSEAIQLVEVTIARDLVAAAGNAPKPKLPSGVKIP